jgi:hypothetical protein
MSGAEVLASHELSPAQFAIIALRRGLPCPMGNAEGRRYFAMLPESIDQEARLCGLTLVSTSETTTVFGEPLRGSDIREWHVQGRVYEAKAIGQGWYLKRLITDASALDQLKAH